MLCDEFVTAMCVPALLSCHAAWRRGEFVREPGVCVCVPCVCVCVCVNVLVCVPAAQVTEQRVLHSRGRKKKEEASEMVQVTKQRVLHSYHTLPTLELDS